MRAFLLAFAMIAAPALAAPVVLRPAQVFDGTAMHAGWQVVIDGDKIVAAGPGLAVPAGATVRELPGATLMPGMIEGHSHLLLHPYDETSWDTQVLNEPLALRTVRATVAALATLRAGFTTVRDLGTEGAGYADVGLKRAIEQGILPGPRMIVATRALVATGAYGPRGFEPGVDVPLGAEAVDGPVLVTAVRRQIGNGADVVKLYADYRWGPGEPSRPTFTQAEMTAAVEAAHSAGRQVTAHASTPEGMRRVILAGVDAIEHGSDGTAAEFKLMRERGVALCPTLAAGDAIARYRGWNGADPAPDAVVADRKSFALARVCTAVTNQATGSSAMCR
jgi:imidazolonepropionase-like amidohydrolase